MAETPKLDIAAALPNSAAPRNLDIQYDPAADVLYCSFGPPQEAIGEETDQQGVVIRRDPKTNALVGITVVDFSQRFITQPGNAVRVPLDSLTERTT